jgi:hypothetical protein
MDSSDLLLGTVRGLYEALGRPLPEALRNHPVSVSPQVLEDPSPTGIAQVIGAAFERVIAARSDQERARRGTHLTPAPLARELARQAFAGRDPATVMDPCCGAGIFLAAAGEIRVERGQEPLRGLIARDLEPLALEATRWTLCLGFPEADVTDLDAACGDALTTPLPAVDLVLTNPPFRSLVRRRSAAERDHHKRLRTLWQPALAGRSDLVSAFVQAAVQATEPNGAVAVLVPESLLTTEAATQLRSWICEVAPPARIDLLGAGHFGGAQVRVATMVLTRERGAAVDCQVGGQSTPVPAFRFVDGAWAEALPPREQLPGLKQPATAVTLSDVASVHRRFTDDFYFINRSVSEGEPDAPHPLVTVGTIDPGRWLWGQKSVRVGGRRMLRPAVDADLLHTEDPKRAERLFSGVAEPRLALATRSRVLEATWLPTGAIAQVPVIEVACENLTSLRLVYAQLLSPPATCAYLALFGHYDQTGAGIELRSKALQRLPLIAPHDIPPAVARRLEAAVEELIETFTPALLRRIQSEVCALFDAPDRQLIDWWWARLPKRMLS